MATWRFQKSYLIINKYKSVTFQKIGQEIPQTRVTWDVFILNSLFIMTMFAFIINDIMSKSSGFGFTNNKPHNL